MKKVLFIGVGRMSTAIINGIKNRNDIDIYGYSKDLKKLEINAKELNIKICSDFNEFKDFDFIFLGVKPNNLNDISEITDFGEKPIILSMLSGIKLEKLIKAFPKNKNIIRIMPNINARIQKSVTGFISKNNIEMEFAVSILNSFGSSFLIEEDKFSEFSVFAGCLPAYTFLFIESLIKSAESSGLEKDVSKKIILDTIMGSIINVYENKAELNEMIDSVCSPGGITIEGLNVLKDNKFESIIDLAMQKAIAKDKQK